MRVSASQRLVKGADGGDGNVVHREDSVPKVDTRSSSGAPNADHPKAVDGRRIQGCFCPRELVNGQPEARFPVNGAAGGAAISAREASGSESQSSAHPGARSSARAACREASRETLLQVGERLVAGVLEAEDHVADAHIGLCRGSARLDPHYERPERCGQTEGSGQFSRYLLQLSADMAADDIAMIPKLGRDL